MLSNAPANIDFRPIILRRTAIVRQTTTPTGKASHAPREKVRTIQDAGSGHAAPKTNDAIPRCQERDDREGHHDVEYGLFVNLPHVVPRSISPPPAVSKPCRTALPLRAGCCRRVADQLPGRIERPTISVCIRRTLRGKQDEDDVASSSDRGLHEKREDEQPNILQQGVSRRNPERVIEVDCVNRVGH